MLRKNKIVLAIVLAAVLLLIAVPSFVKGQYELGILISVFLQLVLVSSLYLIFTTGQMSIAHAAFMGIGAYAAGALVTKLGLSFWLAWPLSGLAAGTIAVLIGLPTLRLAGVYFFLSTFAFGQAITLFFSNEFENVFGGLRGMTNIPVPNAISVGSLFSIDFSQSRIPFYYLALGLMLFGVIVCWQLQRCRIGMIFKSIAMAPSLSQHLGIRLLNYKVLAFAIGCLMAGMVGGFHAHYQYVILPTDFTFDRSLQTLIYMVVGGMGTFIGPLSGASILTLVYERLNSFPVYRAILFGVVLLAVMMFLKEGLVSLPRTLWSMARPAQQRRRPSENVDIGISDGGRK